MRLVLPTSYHEVASSSYDGGEIPAESKRSYIVSVDRRPNMTETLWKVM